VVEEVEESKRTPKQAPFFPIREKPTSYHFCCSFNLLEMQVGDTNGCPISAGMNIAPIGSFSEAALQSKRHLP
jgi:hypothetical protein